MTGTGRSISNFSFRFIRWIPLPGVKLAHAIAGQHQNCKHSQGRAEWDLQAVQAADDEREEPIPFLQQEYARKHVENEASQQENTHKQVKPDEGIQKSLGRHVLLLRLPHVRVREDRVHDKVMHAEEAYAQESQPGEHEVENRQKFHVFTVPALLILVRHVQRQRGRDWWWPVHHGTDYQVNQAQKADRHDGEDEEQHQNQNDFAAADVQQGMTVKVSIHRTGLNVLVCRVEL